jgi:hypothetical protein
MSTLQLIWEGYVSVAKDVHVDRSDRFAVKLLLETPSGVVHIKSQKLIFIITQSWITFKGGIWASEKEGIQTTWKFGILYRLATQHGYSG